MVVRADDCQACNEHQDAGEVDDRWNLRVVQMRLHERELGNDHRDDNGANETCDSLRGRHASRYFDPSDEERLKTIGRRSKDGARYGLWRRFSSSTCAMLK